MASKRGLSSPTKEDKCYVQRDREAKFYQPPLLAFGAMAGAMAAAQNGYVSRLLAFEQGG